MDTFAIGTLNSIFFILFESKRLNCNFMLMYSLYLSCLELDNMPKMIYAPTKRIKTCWPKDNIEAVFDNQARQYWHNC